MRDENGNGWKDLLKPILESIPWHTLRRYEVTNLAFTAAAFYFGYQYSDKIESQMAILSIFSGLVIMGLVCVIWACRQ